MRIWLHYARRSASSGAERCWSSAGSGVNARAGGLNSRALPADRHMRQGRGVPVGAAVSVMFVNARRHHPRVALQTKYKFVLWWS